MILNVMTCKPIYFDCFKSVSPQKNTWFCYRISPKIRNSHNIFKSQKNHGTYPTYLTFHHSKKIHEAFPSAPERTTRTHKKFIILNQHLHCIYFCRCFINLGIGSLDGIWTKFRAHQSTLKRYCTSICLGPEGTDPQKGRSCQMGIEKKI